MHTQINALFMVLALRILWKVKRDQHQKQSENKFQASLELGRLIFNHLLIHSYYCYTCRALLIAAFILLPLLGLTWMFGILTVNANSTVFAWLFTIFNSLQVSPCLVVITATVTVKDDCCIGYVHPFLSRDSK